jgi:hypothetical protein
MGISAAGHAAVALVASSSSAPAADQTRDGQKTLDSIHAVEDSKRDTSDARVVPAA